ncbi:hypothetical protein CFC21_072846 [Triticum aestivum]|uniref:F-box domain-containing protein n=2 Tax=Triticum aestivum TaxID=4565 RepID=A0A9R1KUM6_WHEAT|nr:F-box/kelch-repeat protein At3g23880-like [Triticum aestivum]KAF7066925.1 hypothetical protein CFC21_072846 [Triticum aestivum]
MSPSRPRPAASSSGDLPADALYEVLLRIPAKELCRLRAVCPAWRALTSDPLFAAAHKSRHHTAPPLLAMGYRDDSGVSGVAISDLSGNVVKRTPGNEYELVFVNESGDAIGRFTSKDDSICVVRTRLDLVCFNRNALCGFFWVLNPATGATIDLPMGFSEEIAHELEVKGIKECSCRRELCAFGQVSSSREYKVLRISRVDDRKVCEVITFDDTNHGCWRRKQDPPSHICTSHRMRYAVVDGVVYFLMEFCYSNYETGVITIEPGSVASFNLDTEEWMGVLRGPEQLERFLQENGGYTYSGLEHELSLTELKGCLVVVHNIYKVSMDLWFLTDFENGIWVKKYSLPSHVARLFWYPFLMLDDGRIFFSGMDCLEGILSGGEKGEGFLQCYDPRNGTCTDELKLRDPRSIGIYTGSLLSL